MSALDVAAFLVEVSLLVALAVAGARLGGSPGVGIALAVILPVALAFVWGRWLAPRSRHQLGRRGRVASQLAIVAVAAGMLDVVGSPVWALALLVLGGGIFVIAEQSGKR